MSVSDGLLSDRVEQLGRFFMGQSDVHLPLVRLVQSFAELRIDYAICGAMAVNAHGHQRATTGIDVLLMPEGLARFEADALGRGRVEEFPGSRGVRDADRRVPIDFLLTGGIPGDGTPHGVEFPDPVAAAGEHEGARYPSLQPLIELELASGLSAPDRPRDFDDVIQLIRKNRLGEHFADALHPYVQPK